MAELEIPQPQALSAPPRLRWGSLGAGGIAGLFVDAVHAYSQQRFVAVAARSAERAAAFAASHHVPAALPSYEALVADPDVDVVYVATTHNTHAELALLAITAGKHVIVEKPLAVTRAEAESIQRAARDARVFVMEAMWTRYLPQADVIRQILDAGTIGEVQLVNADFGFHCSFDPAHRLYDPAQAGGALLDAGVYPISFASSVLGPPRSVSATGHVATTGVDADAAVLIAHDVGRSVSLTSVTATLPVRATIAGTSGWIDVHSPFLGPSGLTVHTGPVIGSGGRSATWEDRKLPALHDGLAYEADALARFVGEGRYESPLHTMEETVAIVGALESARSQVLAGAEANRLA